MKNYIFGEVLIEVISNSNDEVTFNIYKGSRGWVDVKTLSNSEFEKYLGSF